MDIPKKVKNSSAIASWSGFIYQGKIALYHCIHSLIYEDSKPYNLKVESLDDFVIYGHEGEVLSLHQVKAKLDSKRSAYKEALIQAAEVTGPGVDKNTKRWFHVARELDDFSSLTPSNIPQNIVEFYCYSDGNRYLPLDQVDGILEKIVSEYLLKLKKYNSPLLIQYKLSLLQTLLDAKVISAHSKIHNEAEIKFDAANKTPISFEEIEECLNAEVLDETDECMILNRFRRNILERTDSLIESNEVSPQFSLADILACRKAIAHMDLPKLKRLYYAKKPNLSSVKLEGLSQEGVENYIAIIALINKLVTVPDLPHYQQLEFGTYLPTAIRLTISNERLSLSEIQNNVEALRENAVVQDVLYEYNNLIVEMKHSPFLLSEASKLTGKFMDVSEVGDQENSRLTKIHNVRFISSEDAQEELSD
ncbi:ABC-three component system protein [Alteromonas sp. OM2203]|uniref:ABC-three component system protein n=1 Tax=Alteromonas sp. OM2203 TaxID=3398817 RepID=UPI003AF3AA8C